MIHPAVLRRMSHLVQSFSVVFLYWFYVFSRAFSTYSALAIIIRESARRSRMRKQQHLDDLNSQLHHLRQNNAEVLASLSFITQLYFEVDSENSVLRIQLMELRNRLMSLTEILHYCLNGSRRPL